LLACFFSGYSWIVELYLGGFSTALVPSLWHYSYAHSAQIKARYSLVVLKVPLNPNQIYYAQISCSGWCSLYSVANQPKILHSCAWQWWSGIRKSFLSLPVWTLPLDHIPLHWLRADLFCTASRRHEPHLSQLIFLVHSIQLVEHVIWCKVSGI